MNMKIGGILLSAAMLCSPAVVLCSSSIAFAETGGTPEQRDACAPDVRKFCHKVKESDGDDAYLQCLELNRDDLSKRCSDMLKSYGK